MTHSPALVTLSHGGGVQTGTLVEMIAAGYVPAPNAVIFADTGDEPAYIYEQVKYHRQRLATVNVPMIIVNNGNMHRDLYEGARFASMPLFTRNFRGGHGKKRANQPDQMLLPLGDIEVLDEPNVIAGFGVEAQLVTIGKLKRQCTSEYKIEPIDRELRIMLLEMGLAREDKLGRIYPHKNALVETWIGFTTDEAERMKPPRNKWQKFRYPLIEMRMSRADCIGWLQARGLPIPKSSHCRKCPLISDGRVMEMKKHDPAAYHNRVRFDEDLRNGKLNVFATVKGELFLHRRCAPLRDMKLEADSQMSMACVNHCMT